MVIIEAIIGFIVARCFSSIDRLNDKLDRLVRVEACNQLMKKHDNEIKGLWDASKNHEARIIKVEAKLDK